MLWQFPQHNSLKLLCCGNCHNTTVLICCVVTKIATTQHFKTVVLWLSLGKRWPLCTTVISWPRNACGLSFSFFVQTVWTIATRFCMEWPIMSWGESSRCRMLQHASSPEPDVVTTLRRCYVNYTASCSAASGVQTCLSQDCTVRSEV